MNQCFFFCSAIPVCGGFYLSHFNAAYIVDQHAPLGTQPTVCSAPCPACLWTGHTCQLVLWSIVGTSRTYHRLLIQPVSLCLFSSDGTFHSLKWCSSVVRVHQNEVVHWTSSFSSVVQFLVLRKVKWVHCKGYVIIIEVDSAWVLASISLFIIIVSSALSMIQMNLCVWNHFFLYNIRLIKGPHNC